MRSGPSYPRVRSLRLNFKLNRYTYYSCKILSHLVHSGPFQEELSVRLAGPILCVYICQIVLGAIVFSIRYETTKYQNWDNLSDYSHTVQAKILITITCKNTSKLLV